MPETTGEGSFYAHGLRFSCKRCSACCRFDAGYVFLSQKDVSLLCAPLDMQHDIFIEKYCRWIPAGNGTSRLSLQEKQNYDCIFWSEKNGEGCMVYKVRPLQCRTFPFWASVMRSKNSWEMTAMGCPGMDDGEHHCKDSIKKMLAMPQMEPIIFRNI